MSDLFEEASAEISECGRFRYALKRRWEDGPCALFIMLNPSTADASVDDPTVRRCRNFAKREGCGSFRIENLFAFRATDPDQMFKHAQTAIGGTDRYIREAASSNQGPIIAAWGADTRARKRAGQVERMLVNVGVDLLCLGTSKSGAPRHPLMVKRDAPLIEYRSPF